MEENDAWENFSASGRVIDYLEYKGFIDRMTNLSASVTDSGTAGNVLFVEESDRKRKEERQNEKVEHAGDGNINGNSTYRISD